MSREILNCIDMTYENLADVHGFTDTAKRQLGRMEGRVMRDGPEGRETALAVKRQVQSAIEALAKVQRNMDQAVELMPTPKRPASVHVIGSGRPLPGALDYAPDEPPGAA